MKIADLLHKSKTHRDGFDPNCPRCLQVHGITGIIKHLRYCARVNESDYKAEAVAAEQRRMIAILLLYRKVKEKEDLK